MVRATAAFALALGLASATSAEAAPPAGAPVDNPFDNKGEEAAPDDQGGAIDSGGMPPAKDAPPSEGGEEPAEGEDEGAQAQTESEGGEGDESQSGLHALTCLEGDSGGSGRRKGVQARDFLKRHRFELSALGGFYASDALSSTYSYGGALAFYASEDFGIELLVTRSPVKFRLEEPFSSFDLQRRFIAGDAYQAIASLLWSPIHAKFKFSDETIVHGDIFFVAGAGRTFHESVLGLTWEAGLGLKLYVSRFVNIRLDVRDFLLPQEVLGRGRITNNVTVLAGVSLWLPG